MNTATDRINEITRESTQAAFETAAAYQQQTANLVQTWFNTVQTQQQSLRDLTLQNLGRAQELQKVWFGLYQDGINRVTETVVAQAEQANGAVRQNVAPKRSEAKAEAK
jgi:hypothetical protein